MNRNIKFGSSVIGNYTTVKLNVKFDNTQIDKLKEQYKDWLSFIPAGKYGCRIEGVLPLNLSEQFFCYDIKKAKCITDAINATEKIKLLEERYMPANHLDWTKANLDEI